MPCGFRIWAGLPTTALSSSTIPSTSFITRSILKLLRPLFSIVSHLAISGSPAQMRKPQGIYFETDYAFNNAMRYDISDQTTHWKTDSLYTSQVNYNFQTPCLLEIYPDKAPGIELRQGESFTSVRTYQLLMDSYDRERRGLAVRKMYRTIAPWTTSNPFS